MIEVGDHHVDASIGIGVGNAACENDQNFRVFYQVSFWIFRVEVSPPGMNSSRLG